MKINRIAHWIVRIRVMMGCLVVAAIVGITFRLSDTLNARINQACASQGAGALLCPVNVGIADLMAAAR